MSDLEMTDEEKKEADSQVKRIEQWLKSGTGKKAVERASRASKDAAKKRADAREIDPKQLEKPVTC